MILLLGPTTCPNASELLGYHRTVLVLLPRAKEMDILLKSGGMPYALQRLKRNGSTEPIEEDRTLAKFVVERLNPQEKASTRIMAEYAVHWNDLEMWNEVVKAGAGDKNIDILGQGRLLAAWRRFSFKDVQPT